MLFQAEHYSSVAGSENEILDGFSQPLFDQEHVDNNQVSFHFAANGLIG